MIYIFQKKEKNQKNQNKTNSKRALENYSKVATYKYIYVRISVQKPTKAVSCEKSSPGRHRMDVVGEDSQNFRLKDELRVVSERPFTRATRSGTVSRRSRDMSRDV